jgi:hypothetical protein
MSMLHSYSSYPDHGLMVLMFCRPSLHVFLIVLAFYSAGAGVKERLCRPGLGMGRLTGLIDNLTQAGFWLIHCQGQSQFDSTFDWDKAAVKPSFSLSSSFAPP